MQLIEESGVAKKRNKQYHNNIMTSRRLRREMKERENENIY